MPVCVEKIMQIRNKKIKFRAKKNVRAFKVPSVPNVNVKSVYELTDLSQLITEPPVTLALTDEELKHLTSFPLDLKIPSSTVAVERCVKITTAFAKVTSDPVLQDGFSLQRISARKKNSCKDRNRKVWKK